MVIRKSPDFSGGVSGGSLPITLKLFYLALRNISQKWTMPIRDWKAALTRFTIQFEDRMNNL